MCFTYRVNAFQTSIKCRSFFYRHLKACCAWPDTHLCLPFRSSHVIETRNVVYIYGIPNKSSEILQLSKILCFSFTKYWKTTETFWKNFQFQRNTTGKMKCRYFGCSYFIKLSLMKRYRIYSCIPGHLFIYLSPSCGHPFHAEKLVLKCLV